MKEVQRDHLRNNGTPAVRHFFYWFDPDLVSEFEVRGSDELVFRGPETYLPGILDKTLRAIEAALNLFPFDYLLRTNVSTICDYALLSTFLAKTPVDYGGSCVNPLAWLDPPSGIVDKRLWGLRFVSGTGIVLSRASCRMMVASRQQQPNEIDFRLIDDVALGDFFARRLGNAAAVDFRHHGFQFVGGASARVPGAMFYRNRLPGDDRSKDVAVMRLLVDSWNKV
jgi:hypothetical protein